MIGRVIFTSEADDDIAEAYNWYESREPGLGEEFLRCLEARILTIRRQPKLCRVAVDEFRRAFLRRFPYEIFTNRRMTPSSSIPFFIVRKTRRNGENALGIDGFFWDFSA
jgi:plasmid stabilization system protein ParE